MFLTLLFRTGESLLQRLPDWLILITTNGGFLMFSSMSAINLHRIAVVGGDIRGPPPPRKK